MILNLSPLPKNNCQHFFNYNENAVFTFSGNLYFEETENKVILHLN